MRDEINIDKTKDHGKEGSVSIKAVNRLKEETYGINLEVSSKTVSKTLRVEFLIHQKCTIYFLKWILCRRI